MSDVHQTFAGANVENMKKAEAGADQNAAPGSATQTCASCNAAEKSECAKKIDAIQQETNKINSISDPIERNKAITAAYKDLAAHDPSNRWIKLASIVSSQGGCAMRQVQGVRSYFPSVKDGLDNATGTSFTQNMYHALGDANKAIFGDIYPYAAYRARYGYENMKKCYAAERKAIPDKIQKSFESLEKNNLKDASDYIADFEQRDVVQRVYDEYKGTFTEMSIANSIQKPFSGKNVYDIPVSTTCGDPNTVPFVGSISNSKDRVNYYNSLMDRLSAQQGWTW